MPPMPGQKGTGKKGRDGRQSRSRNTTPSFVGTAGSAAHVDAGKTLYTQIPIHALRTSLGDELTEQNASAIPTSRDLEALMARMERFAASVEERGSVCDKGMRILAQSRKERNEELEIEKRDEEQKERVRRDLADEEERGRHKAQKIKKRKDVSSAREEKERPLTHGAHGVAPQDGSGVDQLAVPGRDSTHKRKLSKDRDRVRDSASSSLSPVAPATPAAGMDVDAKQDAGDDESSSDEHQPPPAPKIPNHQTFGEDPSTFPDPTVYEIRKVTPGMSEEEKKEIYSVAVYPKNDLKDLIAGTPPDKDFSNAKPTNQVQANTFATYLEPYFRPFTEEDLAFLRERGDRVNPFIIPRRGKKHYTEVWAEEDGTLSADTPHQGRDKLPPNQPRGSIEDLDDSIAETDQVSAGPILSRLLATLRPEHRAAPSEEKPATNGFTNGDSHMNGDMNGDMGEPSQPSDAPAPLPPATCMPDSSSESWKKANHHKLDHAQVDERIKQELRHIGFLPPDTEPDYDAHYDDEIAARLRFLQGKLKEQSIINGARKARLQELTKERMAHQEYQSILEDLDSQVQTAYLKRSRTIGKTKKSKKNPGGAGHAAAAANGTGTARPGIGDVTKSLMEKRKKWMDQIGAVFDDEKNLGRVPRSKDEGSSIFKPETMAEFIRKEKEGWDEDDEEE